MSCEITPCGVVVHPNGKVPYVANVLAGTMAVFDTDTHAVLDTIVLETMGVDTKQLQLFTDAEKKVRNAIEADGFQTASLWFY